MGLKDILNAGMSIVGTKYDGKVKPLGQMTETAQKRQGYLGADGFWTDRAWDRATSTDLKQMVDSCRASSIARKKQVK